MKKLIQTLIISSLLSLAVPALAANDAAPAGGPALKDRAPLALLSLYEAHKTMLGLCGVTGDEADKLLAKDNEKKAKYEAALSEDGKKALPDTLAKLDDSIQKSWDTTAEDVRNKSCDALKSRLAAGK